MDLRKMIFKLWFRASGRCGMHVAGIIAGLLAATLLPASARLVEQGPLVLAADYTEFEPLQIGGPFEFPWSVAFLPDRSMLVTERVRRLLLLGPRAAAREVTGLPPRFSNIGEGHAGLLDVVVDPHFADNSLIYLSHVHRKADRSVLRVLRAKLDLAQAALTEGAIIFESKEAAKAELYGGRLAVSNDGYLFLSLGDRWEREKAQDLSDPAGSIIRIRTDGSIPLDNPFVTVTGARPEIWSYGHRNPLGLAIDDEGRLWSHENGPQGGDELNLIEPGLNYGWPLISHGVEYAKPPASERKGPSTIIGTAKEGMQQPVHYWTPSVAPSGLAIERSEGGLVFWVGTLAGRALIRLELQDGAVVEKGRILEGELGRIRDVRIGPEGALYVLTDGREGALYRLDPVIEQAVRPTKRPL